MVSKFPTASWRKGWKLEWMEFYQQLLGHDCRLPTGDKTKLPAPISTWQCPSFFSEALCIRLAASQIQNVEIYS
jgi:hypothetical protein